MKNKTINMNAIEFLKNYPVLIEEIEKVIKPELLPFIQELKDTDPHTLLTPDAWFVSQNQARGFVLKLFLDKCNR
jgi:hypothetical protein